MSNTKGTVTPTHVLRDTAARGVLAKYDLGLKPVESPRQSFMIFSEKGCNPLFWFVPIPKKGGSKET